MQRISSYPTSSVTGAEDGNVPGDLKSPGTLSSSSPVTCRLGCIKNYADQDFVLTAMILVRLSLFLAFFLFIQFKPGFSISIYCCEAFLSTPYHKYYTTIYRNSCCIFSDISTCLFTISVQIFLQIL